MTVKPARAHGAHPTCTSFDIPGNAAPSANGFRRAASVKTTGRDASLPGRRDTLGLRGWGVAMLVGAMLVLSTACGPAQVTGAGSDITGVNASNASVPFGLVPPATVALSATVLGTGPVDTSVTWQLEAGADGCGALGASVTQTGVFSAPTSPQTYVGGSCKVLAVAAADPTKVGVSTVTITSPTTGSSPALPAFPGAEGGGALTRGGRGGVVYLVTSLADSGVGSLRACVEATGPRTCVFRTGGTIALSSALQVSSPYLTIAGQTAPGDGVAISGKNTGTDVTLRIQTHDVIVRYVRIRKGSYSPVVDQRGGNVGLENDAYNVIFDHVSMSWGNDETFYAYPGTDPTRAPHDITIQSSMVYECLAGYLGQHNDAFIVGASLRSVADAMKDIDIHHSMFANCGSRNPLLYNQSTTLANNLIFNWSWFGTLTGGGIAADVVGNRYKRGSQGPSINPSSQSYLPILAYSIPTCDSCGPDGTPSLYLAGNAWYDGSVPSDQWTLAGTWTSEGGNGGAPAPPIPASWRRGTPRATPAAYVPITVTSSSAAESAILSPTGAGASRRLACDGTWVAVRDSADARQVSNYNAGTGLSSAPTSETDLGGFPALAAGTACADTDGDGIPDAFEQAACGTATCLDPNGKRPDGYTNLEYYLAGH